MSGSTGAARTCARRSRGSPPRQGADQVAQLKHADHRVGAAIGDGQTGIGAGENACPDGLRIIGEIDPGHVGARSHDAAHQTVAEAQDPGDHRPLVALDDARGLGLGHETTDLLLGHRARAFCLLADQPEHRPRRSVEEPHGRQSRARDHPHAGRHHAGDPFGVAQGEVLGDQFADDHRQVGDHADHQGVAQCVGPALAQAQIDQNQGEAVAQSRARDHAGEDADQRDADLNGGQKPPRLLGQREGGLRAGAALLGQGAQPALASRDQGQLRQREDAVERDQQDDDEELDQTGSLSRDPAGRGRLPLVARSCNMGMCPRPFNGQASGSPRSVRRRAGSCHRPRCRNGR